MSSFFANKGYYPSLQVQITREPVSIPAKKFVADLTDTHTRLKQAIVKVQARYQGPTDARCSKAPTF